MNLTNSRGAALAFSLVLLTSLTLLALVGLQRSTMQIRMVSNLQLEQTIKDISYSEVEANFQSIASKDSDNQLILNAINSVLVDDGVVVRNDEGQPQPLPVPISPQSDYGKPDLNVNTSIRLVSIPGTTNHSLAGDSSKGKSLKYRFQLNSEVIHATSGIKSSQELGITYNVRTGG